MIVHADLDAFYASVEQLLNPEYKGKPVIVGGLPNDRRSVVSTASYEARAYGVHSAMPIVKAYELCPCGIFVRGNMDCYKEKSVQVMNVLLEFTPDVQQMSIDEAFLDITGTQRLFGTPSELAKKLKNTVKEKTSLTISLGIASNKYLAKIASGISKPDGLTIIENGNEESFMLDLPVKKIWGAGKKTQEIFKKYDLKTCKQIYDLSLDTLVNIFGNSFGNFLYRAVRGQAAVSFNQEPATHSISSEHTFEYDLYDEFSIENSLLNISYKLIFQILEKELQSKTVHLKIRYSNFITESVQTTLTGYITSVNELFTVLKSLFYSKYRKGDAVRLIGAGLMNVVKKESVQQDLFDNGKKKKTDLEKCIHEINKKFPNAKIKKARLI
ncbi:MAG: DNA polymerase IV [Termitinemataceae bacterium]|nr:MAG: DNA polymerase IV [Termitinemataceae bacterium]